MIDLLGVGFGILEWLGHRPAAREFDPTQHPTVKLAVAALRNGNFASLSPILETLSPDSYRATLEAMLDALDQDEYSAQWLGRLRRWHGVVGDFHSTMALALGLMQHARSIRGGTYASEVDPQAWKPFTAALSEADSLLEQAHAIRPQHPDPLCMHLITARGLQLKLTEESRRFEALLGIDPLHYRGHVSMLENRKAKWGGSHGEMFKFARARAASAPAGHPLHALVLHAHFEMRNLRYWQGDTEADGYFRTPDVADEILDAWRKTVGSDHYVVDANSRELFNLFAAALYLCGHKIAARLALCRMNGEFLNAPWCTMTRNTQEAYNVGWVVDRVAKETGLCA